MTKDEIKSLIEDLSNGFRFSDNSRLCVIENVLIRLLEEKQQEKYED